MSNRSAAGLRRSAIVARIRLREEWSELKGSEEPTKSLDQIPEIIRKQQKPVRSASKLVAQKVKFTKNKTKKSPLSASNRENRNILTSHVPISQRNIDLGAEALRGVVALVDVGTETRALALRAALMALGATVVPVWSPFVTHLVWTQGGCRDTRAKARALACRLVSPLWVEACASCGRRVSEAAFPAAARPSDLPSPRALRIMLKRAEAENIPLADLLNSNNNPDNNPKEPRLRISSDAEHDTSADTSHDQSTDQDTSHDRSADTTDPTIRVNTMPRGGRVPTPPQHPRSRRQLFTHKEAAVLANGDDDETPAAPKRAACRLPPRARRELARAERMAKRMLGAASPARTHTQHILEQTEAPRIVLTGMSRIERQNVQTAIKMLNGKVQKQVNNRTTHVVLGSCVSSENRNDPDNTGIHPVNQSHCSKITSINTRPKTPSTNTRCEIPGINAGSKIPSTNTRCEIPSLSTPLPRCGDKARTLNALLGAARGCRVLYAQWVADSLEVKKWLHHHGYEVQHFRKISQKARVERTALGRTCSEYAYDVFRGMRVRVSPHTEQRDAAVQLLKLCGAVAQNGDDFQDGGTRTADSDVCLGKSEGEVDSKWVFDSVAAGRMRTTRRYVNLGQENAT